MSSHTLGVGLRGGSAGPLAPLILPTCGLLASAQPHLPIKLRSAGAQVIQDFVCDAGAVSSLDLSDNGEAALKPALPPSTQFPHCPPRRTFACA